MTDQDPKRDDIERELVVKDKQALISHCLKLYDTNLNLVKKLKEAQHTIRARESRILDLEMQVHYLKKRKAIDIILEKLRLKKGK